MKTILIVAAVGVGFYMWQKSKGGGTVSNPLGGGKDTGSSSRGRSSNPFNYWGDSAFDGVGGSGYDPDGVLPMSF